MNDSIYKTWFIFSVQFVIFFKNAFTFGSYAFTITVSWCYIITREWWFRLHFIHAENFSLLTKSKYSIEKCSSANILSIIFWNTLDATLHSNGKRLKLYKRLWVLIISNFNVCSSIITCWYASNKSFFENILPPFSFVKIFSALGNGYSYAGEEVGRQLHKNVASNIEQVPVATLNKAPTIWPPASHYKNYPS